MHREINVTVCKGQVQDTDTKDRVVTAKHVYHSFGDALCGGHLTKGVTDSEKLRNQGAGWSSPIFKHGIQHERWVERGLEEPVQ